MSRWQAGLALLFGGGIILVTFLGLFGGITDGQRRAVGGGQPAPITPESLRPVVAGPPATAAPPSRRTTIAFQGQPVSVAFRDSCAGCHGLNREGGAIGPALLPSRLTQSDEFYRSTIRGGRPGTAMPAWGADLLSDEEVLALVAYIKSPPPLEVVTADPNEAIGVANDGDPQAAPPASRIITPAGFVTTLVARLPPGRQPTSVAYGPDGALYIAVLAGDIYRLTDDGRLTVFAGPFNFPMGIAWRGNDLYLSALTDTRRPAPPGNQCPPDPQNRGQVLVLRDTTGDGRADQTRVLIPDLPVGLNARHLVNGLAFGLDDKLYVANGSCENRRQTTDDLRRGTVQRYNPDGTIPSDNPDPRSPVIATGLRNPFDVAIHPVDGTVFATDNGRDDLGDDLPPEELNHIRFGTGRPLRAYGWPECYGDHRGSECQDTEPPVAELEVHASADGLAFYTGSQFGAEYVNNLFIAYYGAGNPARRPFGHKVARVVLTRDGPTYTGRVTDFAVGFERPLDVITAKNGGLIVADFGPIGGTGAIYRIDRDVGASPFAPVPSPTGDPAVPFVAETGHTVAADFARFWQKYGGLEVFGFPISQEFIEDGVVVQYFERARFERAIADRCPDRRPPLTPAECQEFRVRLGLLGSAVARGREREAPFTRLAPFPDSPERRYFPETGHSLSFGFRQYWEEHGGVRVFGLPISEEFTERNPDTGQPFTVQYFERARFEYQADQTGTPYAIQLGRLGAQLARRYDR